MQILLKIVKTKKFIFSVIFILLAIGGYTLFKSNQGIVSVREVKLETVEVLKTVSASGMVTSEDLADISFGFSGKLTTLTVQEGDKVTKGAYLGNIYNYDVTQTTEAYKASRDISLRDKDLFIEDYGDHQSAIGGEKEYEIRLRRLDEAISQAEANYRAAGAKVTNTYIQAPFDGTIVDVYTELGETAVAGTPVLRIADLNNLLFEMNLDQEDFGFLRSGQSVEISLDSYTNQKFKGVIKTLPLFAKSASGTQSFVIKVPLENASDKPALLGMEGDASVIIDKSQGAVSSLTFDAIFKDGDKHYIWIDENGILKKKYIEIGLDGDIYTEVKTDISGVKIVVPETDTFSEGMKVRYAK